MWVPPAGAVKLKLCVLTLKDSACCSPRAAAVIVSLPPAVAVTVKFMRPVASVFGEAAVRVLPLAAERERRAVDVERHRRRRATGCRGHGNCAIGGVRSRVNRRKGETIGVRRRLRRNEGAGSRRKSDCDASDNIVACITRERRNGGGLGSV